MKSFFQLSEQAKQHQKTKLLREVGEATPGVQPQQQQQQNPAQLITAFQAAWDKFYADPNNQAAIKAMQAQKLDTKPIDGLSNTLKTYAAQLSKPTTTQPAAPTAPVQAPVK